MRNIGALIASSFALVAAGCSTHPIPDDAARISTYDIVQKIRCEARSGVASIDPKIDLKYAQIGYLFEFKMSEFDKATSGTLGFANPFLGGSFKLDFSGGAEKERENERTFLVTETLEELMAFSSCDGAKYAANLVYPIAGDIGINETVSTYLRLETELNVGANATNIKNNAASGLFSDKIKFSTTFNAGITPTLELNGGAANFSLRKASISGNIQRKDIHQVILALAYVAPPPTKTSDGIPAPKSGNSRAALENVPAFAPLVSRNGRAIPPPSGDSAKNIVLFELYRLRSLEDDRRIFDPLNLGQ